MAVDLTISTEDRPGELARVGEALGAAGVNIEGVCGLAVGGGGVIHVCVNDGDAARAALESSGIEVEGQAEALLLGPFESAAEPGALGAMARRIADAGINVRALYLATGDRGVLVTEDNARVAGMLQG
jgi:hypothetical protein